MVASARGRGTTAALAVLLTLHCVAIALFVRGFLLTRIHLSEKSTQDASVCARPYDKLIWIVIDALRYDFVVVDGRYPCLSGTCQYQRRMPQLSSLLSSHPHAVKSFRYIADAPTTTTQRLKCMVSGGLPTFFDVSNAFTAQTMDEDNLIDQLNDSGRKLAFMGDATWANLFPHQFNLSLPFPCFNVKDLDTVDDGIWEHLLPTLQRPEAWDVLIAHYLGVDHCGHSFGVDSARMSQKLRQMDDHIAAVLNELVAGGGSGGPYENALLLVAGDHGQTLGGDHGGGSPEEVDSTLIAIDIAGLSHAMAQQKLASHGQEHGNSNKQEIILDGCRSNCTCGEDRNQCTEDLPQIDLVPTLAVMLGLSVPFGNLGSLSPELWSLAATRCALNDGSSNAEISALAKAVSTTVNQVHRYLNRYAAHPRARFPSASLKHLNEKYARTMVILENSSCGEGEDCGVSAGLDFLAIANDIARQVWTQFGDGPMVLGVCIFLATIIWHGILVWRAVGEHAVHWDIVELSMVVLLAVGVIAQSLGLFSFFYLLSEGSAVSWILCGMTFVITIARCVSTGPQPHTRWRVVALGITAVACVWAAGRLGLASHSGYGFWQRLTVHEPQDVVVVNKSMSAIDAQQPAVAWWDFGHLTLAGWTAIARFLGEYTIPTLVLVHLMRRSLSEMMLPRALLTSAYGLLSVHNAIEFFTRQGVLPERLSLAGAFQLIQAFHFKEVPMIASSLMRTASAAAGAQLPLHLLLPRMVFTLSAMIVGLNSLMTWRRMLHPRITSILFAAALALVMLLLSSTLTPLLVVIWIAQASVLLKLAGHSSSSSVTVLGLLDAAMQAQGYFITGHLCEFAGLQYTAGFVGYEDFQLLRSGAFVAIDTFGGMAMALLGSVLAAAPLPASDAKEGSDRRRSKAVQPNFADRLHTMLILIGFSRALTAFCATLSAGIQRRHLYAWALFAPRFAFEVFFLVCTDVILLLLSSLA